MMNTLLPVLCAKSCGSQIFDYDYDYEDDYDYLA